MAPTDAPFPVLSLFSGPYGSGGDHMCFLVIHSFLDTSHVLRWVALYRLHLAFLGALPHRFSILRTNTVMTVLMLFC